MKAIFNVAGALGLCLTLTACTVHKTEAPPVAGPSDFALSARMEANPDTIGQDGGSQSSIRVFANGPDGKPLAGVTFRVDMAVFGVAQDFGALSARSIVTGSDGVARVIYTAPAADPTGNTGTCNNGLPGTCVTIIATPTSTAFGTVRTQQVTIRLVPLGVIRPPASTPTPCILAMTPSPAVANLPVQFTAGTSVTQGSSTVCQAASSDIVSFEWNFGDGSTASGRTVSHTFGSGNQFSVTLTETNDRGLSGSTTQQVTVGAATLPTAVFTFSPAAPGVNETVFFNASTSTPGPGHTITSYRWTFGDGGTASGVNVTHAFAAAGNFIVQLTVTDEAGQSNTSAGTSLAIGNPPGPSSNFTFSPTNPAVNEQVVFDASTSTTSQGQTIVDYAWNFGDDTPIIHGNSRIISHSFARAGNFVVNLVVTDSAGRTGSHAATVPVTSGAPTASFTFATFNAATHTMTFDGSASSAQGGATIASWSWTFGDATSGTGRTIQHTYLTGAGTYTVTLTVTDSLGRAGATSQSVAVP
jgi:PKD repeat protein